MRGLRRLFGLLWAAVDHTGRGALLFSLFGASACSAVAGAVTDMPLGWEIVFLIGVFGMAATTLVVLAPYALDRLPTRTPKPKPIQQPDGSVALARRVLVELDSIDSTVFDARERGRWWNPAFTALPGDKWDAAADTLDGKLHDALYPIYVEADALNQAAMASLDLGEPGRLDARAAIRLEVFREEIARARAVLRGSLAT